MPTSSLRSSLLQETVRRLLNGSPELYKESKQKVLSSFGQKLINSGHSSTSARIILVQGVVKYLWLVERSKLAVNDMGYKPLYLSKEHCEDERQIHKCQAKRQWFRSKKNKKDLGDSSINYCVKDWRQRLKGIWKGSGNSQRPVLVDGYSTVINVPNTEGAILAKKLIEAERKLAKLTKYNVKVVEKSGIQLIRLFKRVYSPDKCHWSSCPVCKYSDSKGSTKCRQANVVYEAECCECLKLLDNGIIGESEVGVYIGETSRSLIERAREHVACAERVDVENFITKHWALKHEYMNDFPKIRFRVIKRCKDALTRQVTEAVWIKACGNLNSKAEWGRNAQARLKVDSDN